MSAEFEVEALTSGNIFIKMSGTSLDHHLPDPEVSEHFTPKEAYELALEIMHCVIKSGKTKNAN
jgi:hypothetical protein